MTAPLISERVRCACCPAETSLATLETAPTTMGWTTLEGFRFCETCSPRAADVVALDRERNAHQRTIGQLEAVRELAEHWHREAIKLGEMHNALAERPTLKEERVREVVRATLSAAILTDGPTTTMDEINEIATRAAKELAGAVVVVAKTAPRCECHLEAGDSLCPVHPPDPDELVYAASIGAPYSLPNPAPAQTVAIGPADIAIIDRALERWTDAPVALGDRITAIRALLASPGGGS